MNWKARYYGVRGRCGYVHAACLLEFQAANTRYDAQGRAVSTPEVDSMLDDLGHAAAGKCLHCGNPLATDYSSSAERDALALAADKKELLNRLQEARSVLTAAVSKQFGKGRFDFPGRRLVGENGIVLQWRTRCYPDKPESYENQQTTRGCVVCLEETSALRPDVHTL
jgi:hypothetical protein